MYQRNKGSKVNLFVSGILLCLFVTVFFCTQVFAKSGQIYSCTINASYSHPITGIIEDSGGEASYATGQGMAAGVVNAKGLLEVTDSGQYYLTVRFSLMDYTSDHTFAVQKTGESGWTESESVLVGNGSDSNGTTADVRIQIPTQDCILKISMYVNPMGRNVIFYMYPNAFAEGQPEGMQPSVVTEVTQQTKESSAESAEPEREDTAESVETGEANNTPSIETETMVTADTGMTTAVVNADAADGVVNQAQGLSLSTAEEAETMRIETENSSLGEMSWSVKNLILAITLSLTLSGLILMAAGAGLIYFFRKNWRRWGGDDEEED